MKHFILFLLFALSFNARQALASCEGSPDIVVACEELEAAEAKLNLAYRNLLAKLDNPPAEMAEHHKQTKRSVILAQRAWLRFRDLDCSAVSDIADGTSRAPLSISCAAEHSLLRAKQLEEMVSGL